jgi:hypothetical protein
VNWDFDIDLEPHEIIIILLCGVLPWGVGVFVLGRSLLGLFL